MIPVNEPLLTEADVASVTNALRSGWISGAGPHVEEFETRWAAYCGRKHGVAVANGSVALQVAVALLDLQPGDEVIMPAFTIISCAWPGRAGQCCRRCWSIPIHARGPWTSARSAPGSPRARARSCRSTSTATRSTCSHCSTSPAEYGLEIIEDAAEAHGADYRGRRIGSFGTVSCFSFYANKLVTTGEGGMVLVDDDALAERARRLRNLGFQPGRRFLHGELGYNFRLTNLQAALGVTQVERIDAIVARKRDMGRAYTDRLSEIAEVELQVEQPGSRSVYWMYGLSWRAKPPASTRPSWRAGLRLLAWKRGRSFSACTSSRRCASAACSTASPTRSPNGWRARGCTCRPVLGWTRADRSPSAQRCARR